MDPTHHTSTIYNRQKHGSNLTARRQMDGSERCGTHTHNGIVLGREKESNNDIQQRGMNLEIIVLSELSQRKTSTI